MNLSLISVAHWMGDFLFQTTNMATKKAHSLKWLSLHILVYGFILLVFSVFLFGWKTGLIYALFNAALHFVTDFLTSKVIVRYLKKPRIFFPLLGFDQLIHILTLHLSLIYLDKIREIAMSLI